MAATPFLINLSPRLADIVLRLPLPKKLKSGSYTFSKTKVEDKNDHVIIIGFGVNGRNVAKAARAAEIPYAIIEMNPETVRSEQARGEPIFYGDATQETVLQHANIKDARIVVIVINDPTTIRRIIENTRRHNLKAHLIVRTRYLQEMKPLYELGANEVIPEEFETSVEIFSRVLTKYLIPRNEIERLVAEVRADGYEMLRSLSNEPASFSDLKLQLHDVDISSYRISQGSQLIGKTLAQIDVRRRYGITVVAIRRESRILPNPGADTLLQVNDMLFVLGSSEKISEVIHIFSSSHERNNKS
jgi:CPA2 family monovalent cation:H+ antiporter-2